jgi:hypothetical protein
VSSTVERARTKTGASEQEVLAWLARAQASGRLVTYTRPARMLDGSGLWTVDVTLRPAVQAQASVRWAGRRPRVRRWRSRRTATALAVTVGALGVVTAGWLVARWLVGQVMAWLSAHAGLLIGATFVLLVVGALILRRAGGERVATRFRDGCTIILTHIRH